jgi:hypothetical protein
VFKEFSIMRDPRSSQVMDYLLKRAEDLCSATFDNYNEPGTLWVNDEGNRCIGRGFAPTLAYDDFIRTKDFMIAYSYRGAQINFFKLKGKKIVGFISFPDSWGSSGQSIVHILGQRISTCRKLLFVLYQCAGEKKIFTYSVRNRNKLS